MKINDLHSKSMVTFAIISVFGKLLARHVMIECWWVRDKFLITNLLVCIDVKISNIILSSGFPFQNHVMLGGGEPPRISHNNTISLPSSYGPAIA